jgi:hypothetical protein
VDIWRERVVLKDEEGSRRTIALEALKAEVAIAGGVLTGESRDSSERSADRGPYERNGDDNGSGHGVRERDEDA